MIVVNFIIICIIVILSYIFNMAEIKKYDTQTMFIILSFTILILYRLINHVYYKNTIVKEKFNVNDFINDTLSTKEKIKFLENKIKLYEDTYGSYNILNDDNLENKIQAVDSAISNLSAEYEDSLESGAGISGISLDNTTPTGGQNILGAITTDNLKKAFIDAISGIDGVASINANE